VKAIQPARIKNAAATLFKKIKSVHSVPLYNIINHQLLYLKKILTQKVSKNWEGFNSQIKT